MPQISLTIDGIEIEADEGTMVLDVARKAGIEIPTVCAHEDLAPYGACRLCIV
ncbi:MAG: 2Fe-2S iron-sulfur cluster-binding protein, partial [Planctomycetota bacterium]|nr:2Fe-2S iron-sulfur cluster-binding protein [Planctomycetota bacterium]